MAKKAKMTKKEKNKLQNNIANITVVTIDDVKNSNDSGIINVVKGANPYKIGDIVLALAGRDKDAMFAVVGVVDNEYVLIANGRSRRIDIPKKKKIKHIKLLNEAGGSFAERMEKSKSGRLTNLILRTVISEYAVQVFNANKEKKEDSE